MQTISAEEQAFLTAIHAEPDATELRLVYADWLEERGNWRAQYIRLRAQTESADNPQAVLSAMEPLFARQIGDDVLWSSQLRMRTLFLCRTCRLPLSLPLRIVTDQWLIFEEDNRENVQRGFYFCGDFGAWGEHGHYCLNLNDRVNCRHHPDSQRLHGCCGLHGCSGPNTVCRNGHEVGTERSDCWMPHGLWLDPNLVNVV